MDAVTLRGSILHEYRPFVPTGDGHFITWLDSTPVLNCVTIVCFQITSSVVSYDHPTLPWYTIITLLQYLCLEVRVKRGIWNGETSNAISIHTGTENEQMWSVWKDTAMLAHGKPLLTKHYFCVPGGHMRMSLCIPRSENQTQETQESLDRCRARQWHSLMTLFVFCSEITVPWDFANLRLGRDFYINRDTNLQLSFPPSAWVLFPDQNQLARSQGELLGTSGRVGSNNLGNFWKTRSSVVACCQSGGRHS